MWVTFISQSLQPPFSPWARPDFGSPKHFKFSSQHRSPQFDQYILPQCQRIIKAVEHRMTCDAAMAAERCSCILDLYVFSCHIQPCTSRKRVSHERSNYKAITETLLKLKELLDELVVEYYLIAPVVSDTAWDEFIVSLKRYDSRSSQRKDSQSPRDPSRLRQHEYAFINHRFRKSK